jgi:predicted DNA binding protein
MNNFEQLIQLSRLKKEAELELAKKRDEFEMSIENDIQLLESLKVEENRLREEVATILEKNNEDKVIVGDMSINRQIRKTKKIEDPALLLSSIVYNEKSLSDLGIDLNEIKDKYFANEVVVKDKKSVMDIIEKYEDLEGKLLEGVIEQKTQFLTIKNNN